MRLISFITTSVTLATTFSSYIIPVDNSLRKFTQSLYFFNDSNSTNSSSKLAEEIHGGDFIYWWWLITYIIGFGPLPKC